jgi:hypothetical protein
MLNNSLNNSFDDSYINYGFSSAGRGALHQRYAAAALMHTQRVENTNNPLLSSSANCNNYGGRFPNFKGNAGGVGEVVRGERPRSSGSYDGPTQGGTGNNK